MWVSSLSISWKGYYFPHLIVLLFLLSQSNMFSSFLHFLFYFYVLNSNNLLEFHPWSSSFKILYFSFHGELIVFWVLLSIIWLISSLDFFTELLHRFLLGTSKSNSITMKFCSSYHLIIFLFIPLYVHQVSHPNLGIIMTFSSHFSHIWSIHKSYGFYFLSIAL